MIVDICMGVKRFAIYLLPNVFTGNISNGNPGRASAGQLVAFIANSIYLVAIPPWQSNETNNRFNLCKVVFASSQWDDDESNPDL